MRYLKFLCVSSLALILCLSCSSSKSRVGGTLGLETDIKLTFIVDKNINPDEHQRPSPVFVRLYELKSSTVFSKADFIDLYEQDATLLKTDLVGKQVLKPFSPGDTREERLVLQDTTREVGLYVEFSQYRGSTFRAVFPIVANNVRGNSFNVKISGTTITVEKK